MDPACQPSDVPRQDLPQTVWGDFARIAMGLSVLAVWLGWLFYSDGPVGHSSAGCFFSGSEKRTD